MTDQSEDPRIARARKGIQDAQTHGAWAVERACQTLVAVVRQVRREGERR